MKEIKNVGYKLNDHTFIWTDKRAAYYWNKHLLRFIKWISKQNIEELINDQIRKS